jgi:hypothetical protein
MKIAKSILSAVFCSRQHIIGRRCDIQREEDSYLSPLEFLFK